MFNADQLFDIESNNLFDAIKTETDIGTRYKANAKSLVIHSHLMHVEAREGKLAKMSQTDLVCDRLQYSMGKIIDELKDTLSYKATEEIQVVHAICMNRMDVISAKNTATINAMRA